MGYLRSGWLGLFLLSSLACSSDETTAAAARRAQLAEGCLLNSDCQDPLVCAFRRCHTQCTSPRDCPSGMNCVQSDKPFYVCQLPDEQKCTYNSQCYGQQICGVDGKCRDQCLTDPDCLPEHTCASRTCAQKTELTPEGRLPHALPAEASKPCLYSDECETSRVCRQGACVFECKDSRDCAAPLVCVENRCKQDAGAGGAGGCLLPSDCPEPQICRSNGTCGPQCVEDRDCLSSQRCVGAVCVADSGGGGQSGEGGQAGEAGQGGSPAGQGGAGQGGAGQGGAGQGGANQGGSKPEGYGDPCLLNSDCSPGLVCGKLARCVFECVTAADCPDDQCCSPSNACIPAEFCAATGGAGGAGGSAGQAGTAGSGGACSADADCQNDSFCDGFERCQGGLCQPSTKDACDDDNPCTSDTCNEATKKCAHTQTGPQDEDGDGHYAASCGGPADDCDDKNPKAYPGAPELCDGVDNNCDGQIDEGVWKASPPVSLAAGMPASGDANFHLNAPGVVVLPTVPPRILVAGLKASSNDVVGIEVDEKLALKGAAKTLFAGASATGIYGMRLVSSGNRVGLVFRAKTNGEDTILIKAGQASGAFPSSLQNAHTFNYPGAMLSPTITDVAAAWSGDQLQMIWGDLHIANEMRMFTRSLSTGGQLSASLPVFSYEQLGGASFAYNLPPVMNLVHGQNSALLVWRVGNGDNHVMRYALMESNLATIKKGVFETSLPGVGHSKTQPTSVVALGSGYLIASQPTYGDAGIHLSRIDPATGKQLTPMLVPAPSPPINGPQPALVPIQKGAMLVMSSSGAVHYGWVPEDLGKGATAMQEIPLASPPSGVAAAAIDDKRVILVWQDTDLRATVLTCGP